ncbi:catalytic core [Podarcis lilfordi]|uniref:Catalytic core n=1 Tax=Podarcis lilfordi TaxID=74358 RepID=A0AA35L1B2_9SAUR|nr:catalytic core [Podarcis lilfordi]
MLFLQLQRRGKRFPDLDQVYILLSSLPPSFNIVIASLESMRQEDLLMAYQEESEKPVEKLSKKADQRSLSRPANQKPRFSGGDGTEERPIDRAMLAKKCYRCGKLGHMKKDCCVKNPGKASDLHETEKQMHFILVAARKEKKIPPDSYILGSGSARIIMNNNTQQIAKRQGQHLSS